MTHLRKISIVLLSLLTVTGLVAIGIIILSPKDAVAQTGEGDPGTASQGASAAGSSAEGAQSSPAQAGPGGKLAWTSSAEAPTGTSVEMLSPPDTDAPTGLEADDAPDALISWRVAGSALKPRQNDVSYSVGGSGACTYVTSGDSSTVWNIPVILPQGTLVDTLRMYYYDTSASNSSAWFTVYDLYGSIVQEWSVTTSGNSGNGFNDSALISHTVDYSVYSYLLNWRPNGTGASLQLCGFRIFHDPPSVGAAYMPMIEK